MSGPVGSRPYRCRRPSAYLDGFSLIKVLAEDVIVETFVG